MYNWWAAESAKLAYDSYGVDFNGKLLKVDFMVNQARTQAVRNSQDKTHFVLSLSGETEFAKGWFLNGEAQLQKGAHDKDLIASVQFKRVW